MSFPSLQKKTDIFVAAFIVISFFALICFALAIGKSEGDIGRNYFLNMLADHAGHIFPLVLISDRFELFHPAFIILALGLNLILYSIIATFIIYRLLTNTSYQPFQATHYSVVSIVVFLIMVIISAIINSSR